MAQFSPVEKGSKGKPCLTASTQSHVPTGVWGLQHVLTQLFRGIIFLFWFANTHIDFTWFPLSARVTPLVFASLAPVAFVRSWTIGTARRQFDARGPKLDDSPLPWGRSLHDFRECLPCQVSQATGVTGFLRLGEGRDSGVQEYFFALS